MEKRDFYNIWQEAHLRDLPVEWVADSYGCSVASARRLAASYRKTGAQLPELLSYEQSDLGRPSLTLWERLKNMLGL